jgi:hypothetical protein
MAPSTQSTGAGHGTSQIDHSSQPSHAQDTIPVEMSDIEASQRTGGAASTLQSGLLNDVSIPTTSPMNSSFPTTRSAADVMAGDKSPEESNAAIPAAGESAKVPLSSSNTEPTTATATSASGPESTSSPAITRLDSVAISPSTDDAQTPVVREAGPVLVITLLLTSGARHPYKIDEKYLTKRNVNVPGVTESGKKDPFSISVYTLKELILREWREEWEAQPSSPSSIRLIYFGRLLDDKTPLKGTLY